MSTLFLGVTLHSRALLGVSMVVASTVCFNRAAELPYSSSSELGMVEDDGILKGTYREVALVDEDERATLAPRESPEPRRVARGLAATASAAV